MYSSLKKTPCPLIMAELKAAPLWLEPGVLSTSWDLSFGCVSHDPPGIVNFCHMGEIAALPIP